MLAKPSFHAESPGSPRQSALKRFSVFSSNQATADTVSEASSDVSLSGKTKKRPKDKGSPQLQYSDSMPVFDSAAPYAVSPAANVVIPSSPTFRATASFDSDRASLNSSNRPVASSPLLQDTSAANQGEKQSRSFLGTPAMKRNSMASFKLFPPLTLGKEPKLSDLVDKEKEEERQKQEQLPDYHIKLVSVGDGGCGKTCLMVTYTYGKFPTEYMPTIFENYLTQVRSADGKLIELALWDTAGQEEYDRLRVLSYPEVNILLVCFAIDNPISLDNVLEKWFPEVSHFCPGIPFFLVGLKSDTRDEADPAAPPVFPGPQPKYVTREQGQAMARRIGANRYMECSAFRDTGVSNIFNTATSLIMAEHLGLPEPPVEDLTTPKGGKIPKKQGKGFRLLQTHSAKDSKEPKTKRSFPSLLSKPTKNSIALSPSSSRNQNSTTTNQHFEQTKSRKSPLSAKENEAPEPLDSSIPRPVTEIAPAKKKKSKKTRCIII